MIALAVVLALWGALAFKAYQMHLAHKRPPVNPDLEAIFAKLDVLEGATADCQALVTDARDRVGALELAGGLRRAK